MNVRRKRRVQSATSALMPARSSCLAGNRLESIGDYNDSARDLEKVMKFMTQTFF